MQLLEKLEPRVDGDVTSGHSAADMDARQRLLRGVRDMGQPIIAPTLSLKVATSAISLNNTLLGWGQGGQRLGTLFSFFPCAVPRAACGRSAATDLHLRLSAGLGARKKMIVCVKRTGLKRFYGH